MIVLTSEQIEIMADNSLLDLVNLIIDRLGIEHEVYDSVDVLSISSELAAFRNKHRTKLEQIGHDDGYTEMKVYHIWNTDLYSQTFSIIEALDHDAALECFNLMISNMKDQQIANTIKQTLESDPNSLHVIPVNEFILSPHVKQYESRVVTTYIPA